jgi:hypothetical protein
MAEPWGPLAGEHLSGDEEAWMRTARGWLRPLAVLAAFAIGLGLILVGIGNGIWRLTALGGLDDPRGLVTFLFHLGTAATLVVLGATLLPIALGALGGEASFSFEQPALVFATLWLLIGAFQLLTGSAVGGEAIGGSIVLLLAGLFGLLAVSLYDPRFPGPSLSAGVLGLVAGGLLIGGVATVPESITGSSRFGAELVYRYGEAIHVSGYLLAVLAATVHPFVREDVRGRAGVLLGLGIAGLVWGIGEVVFTAWWLAEAPWTLFAEISGGASVGYAFVLAGGLATVVGGIATLGAASAGTAYAGLALASRLGPEPEAGEAEARARECPSCGAQTTTGRAECPGCGHELAAA